MIKNLKKLENIIGYKFKDPNLLKQSLTHKSFDNIKNNEKLEFLGDRVLGLVIAKKLIDTFPKEKEGIIDKRFANLVNKKTCSKISKNIFMGTSLRLNRMINQKSPENFGNLYIPGFNIVTEDNNFGTGITYTLTYRIPIVKK